MQKKPLISPDEILRFPQGKCVITSPVYATGTEALFPYPLKIPVRPGDIKRAKESEKLWDSSIRPQLERRAKALSVEQQTGKLLNIDEELDQRIRFAYQLLPHPNDPEEPVTVADVKSPVNAASANSAAGKIAVGNIRKKLKTLSFGGDR